MINHKLEYLDEAMKNVPFEDRDRFADVLIGALSNAVPEDQWKRAIGIALDVVRAK